MTVILPLGRNLTRSIIPRSNYLLTRFASSRPHTRASQYQSNESSNDLAGRSLLNTSSIVSAIRAYATAASSKPVGRPKAHTGRVTAKKSATKTKAVEPKKKPAAGAKVKSKPKSKPKPKPKKKSVRAKPKPKAKRAGRTAPTKSALNQARIARNKDLKAQALFTEPKQLPSTTWLVYCTQNRSKTNNLVDTAADLKEMAKQYKQLSPEEREKLNHTSNQNKAKNEADYKNWVSQHSPTEIRDANSARRTLAQQKKVKDGKKPASVHLIKDDRLVTRARNPYIYFVQDRYASGDFNHMKVIEVGRLVGREWKELSASEKQPYQDKARADSNRFIEEAQTVYGKTP